jgi:hypothetical protein
VIKVIRGIGTLILAGIFVAIAVPVYVVSGIVGTAVVVFKSIFDSPWG